MLRERFSKFWHKNLGRPFRLYVGIDQNPTGLHEVVFLHGIGRSSVIWQRVAENLRTKPYHLLAFDLLGFGDSPKPDWLDYTVDDHAQAVIAATLKFRRHNQPLMIVGHSMGCLVAIRIAVLRPDLVARLILYQPPIYIGLPNEGRYTLRKDLYFSLYKRFVEEPVTKSQLRLREMLIKRTGILVQPEILVPFLRSLEHTIMEQTTLQDMQGLQLPIDIIYGSRDLLVIRGTSKNIA